MYDFWIKSIWFKNCDKFRKNKSSIILTTQTKKCTNDIQYEPGEALLNCHQEVNLNEIENSVLSEDFKFDLPPKRVEF